MSSLGARSKRIERTDIEFPLWRKKVDNSIFRDGGTTVPNWAARMWEFDRLFPGVFGKTDDRARVVLHFATRTYAGWVTCTKPEGRKSRVYRLYFDDTLRAVLENTFLMSYMRDLESRLQRGVGNIETEIPFWEFLDIEFDSEVRVFHLAAHYTHPPLFPELFRRLTSAPVVRQIEDEIAEKEGLRIYKQHWKTREEYETELGATNVIYTLIDTKNQAVYIGETENLIKRFRQGHPTISNWDFYRYDLLPPDVAPFRVPLERMLIRCFASLLANKRNIHFKPIGDFRLANERIDVT